MKQSIIPTDYITSRSSMRSINSRFTSICLDRLRTFHWVRPSCSPCATNHCNGGDIRWTMSIFAFRLSLFFSPYSCRWTSLLLQFQYNTRSYPKIAWLNIKFCKIRPHPLRWHDNSTQRMLNKEQNDYLSYPWFLVWPQFTDSSLSLSRSAVVNCWPLFILKFFKTYFYLE